MTTRNEVFSALNRTVNMMSDKGAFLREPGPWRLTWDIVEDYYAIGWRRVDTDSPLLIVSRLGSNNGVVLAKCAAICQVLAAMGGEVR